MNNIKHILLFLFVLFLGLSAVAQIDIYQYFDQNSIPLINRSKPMKVAVKWDMDGKSQILLNESLNYLDEGKLTVSLATMDSFLVRNYNGWVGHYYRGQILMRMSRFKEAEVEFTATTKLNPSLIEGYIQLSEAFELQLDLGKAREPLLKAVNLNPKYVYAYYKLGNLELLSRDEEAALSYYKKCTKVDPKFPDAYMTMGIISFLKDKKIEQAISLINKSISADSTYESSYFWRGLIYLENNEKQKCLVDWNHFLMRNPRNQFVKAMRGFLNTELGNYETAFSDFRKILQNTTVGEDKFQAAQTALDKRIDLQFAANYLIQKGYGIDEEAFSHLKAGFCLMVLGRDRDAMNYLKKADRMATSPAIYFLMAIAYEHGGVHNAAFQFYNKTLEYDNDVFDAHKKRSIYFSELKRWDDAYKDIKEMFRLQPASPAAYRLKGIIESAQEKYTDAIRDLSLFIKTDSTDTEALRNRALCYSLTGLPQKANRDFARILVVSQTQLLHENLVNDALKAKDTLNSIFLLKKFYDMYRTSGSLVELSKIWIAQKKFSEISSQVNDIRVRLKEEEKSQKFLLILNHPALKSTLSLIEGMVAYSQSSYEEAIRHLTVSLKENQNNLESKYLRGKCFAKTSNTPKALKDFEDLKNQNYKDAEALYVSLKK